MSMKRFRKALLIWIYGFVGGCLGGGAAAVAAALGLTGAQVLGVNVPPFNFNTIKVVFLSGILTHAVLFVMKSPLPQLEFDDTVIIPNPNNNKKEDEKTPVNP